MNKDRGLPIREYKTLLKQSVIERWGKIRFIDSEEGDTIRASSLGTRSVDTRDASYVRVSPLL
jgi:hypothetical protein